MQVLKWSVILYVMVRLMSTVAAMTNDPNTTYVSTVYCLQSLYSRERAVAMTRWLYPVAQILTIPLLTTTVDQCVRVRALQCESAQKARKNVRTPEPAIDGVDNLDGGSIQKLI